MQPAVIFILLPTIFIVDFAFDRTLSWLNIKHSTDAIPEPLRDMYDAEKYEKQQRYIRAQTKFGWCVAFFNFTITLIMLLCDGYAWLDGIVRTWTSNELLVSLIFIGILFLFSEITSIPISIYRTFVIETRFGFNKKTPKLFVTDRLKGLALSIILDGSLLTITLLIYQQIPDYFWLVAWAVVTTYNLFMGQFYSKLIVPLFNKQTPLEAGELRSAIEQFAQQCNFQINNIYVIDSSKRSTKANAYFTGWGKRKRIVLYDTLINKLTTKEIVAVLAHEIGHDKHHHTLRSLAISLPMNLLMFILLGLFLNSDPLAQALGCSQASFHINMLAFSFLYTPISNVLDWISNIISRRHEYQADDFVKVNGYAEEQISALKKITAHALRNLTPHPLYVFLYYSHPTLLQRITALRNNPTTN
ncbi:MAG: M48 family metallopeptidase [Bacteroidales bacterium]|nr:M48 family metallopeptidase [Bacteroidales bacterium]